MTLPAPKETSLPAPRRLAVHRVSLAAFRNYDEARVEPDGASVVLTGENGSGKTNIMEAISLLVPGRGLRRAPLSSLQNTREPRAWGVAAEIDGSHDALHIGTGRDPEASVDDTARRIVRIDGRPVKNQQTLADHVAMTWITPDMDRVLSEGASARRKFLDRLAYSFDPAHAGRIQRYEKAMRERLCLLREGGGDPVWFKALEDTMAQTGVAIAAGRRDMLLHLQAAMEETIGLFPQADLDLLGSVERALEDTPALLVEDRMRDDFARTRTEDALNGTTSIGPHRTDLGVTHRCKACPAELCSTGEQKALVIAIMLAYLRSVIRARNVTPILLLDDIAAHLDAERREGLFAEIDDLGVQAWMTGTEPFQFASFLKNACAYRVTAGRIDA